MADKTKAIIAKGEKEITNQNDITIANKISRVLGCWIINHRFKGSNRKSIKPYQS